MVHGAGQTILLTKYIFVYNRAYQYSCACTRKKENYFQMKVHSLSLENFIEYVSLIYVLNYWVKKGLCCPNISL